MFPEIFFSSHVWMWDLDHKEGWAPKNWCLWTVVTGEDSWESLGLQEDQTSQSWRKSTLNIHWKDWCWSSNTLAAWCEKLPHWKRPWCWERWKTGGEGGNRGWDGWMASPTRWTWVWASPGRWWRTRKSDVLQSMGLQKVGHNWMTEQLQRLANSQVHRNFFVKYHRFCFTWKWQTWLNYILWKIFL